MTEFFDYQNLTWPEIARLPRDTPLVIPLGAGYNLHQLAEALGSPKRVGYLPAIPFGWQGSGLPVPEGILRAMLSNLVASLREDGFSRVFALTPQGLGLETGFDRFTLPTPWRLNPAAALPDWEHNNKVLLFPIGHTEQHGFHLPIVLEIEVPAVADSVYQMLRTRLEALIETVKDRRKK